MLSPVRVMLLFLRRKETDLGAYQASMNALFSENVNSFLPLTHLGKKILT